MFLRLKAIISQSKQIKSFLGNVNLGSHTRTFSSNCENEMKTSIAAPFYMMCSKNIHAEECQTLFKDMVVFENFLSESEEKTIFDEIEPYMSRLHYEYDHWDNVSYIFLTFLVGICYPFLVILGILVSVKVRFYHVDRLFMDSEKQSDCIGPHLVCSS